MHSGSRGSTSLGLLESSAQTKLFRLRAEHCVASANRHDKLGAPVRAQPACLKPVRAGRYGESHHQPKTSCS